MRNAKEKDERAKEEYRVKLKEEIKRIEEKYEKEERDKRVNELLDELS